MVRKAGPFSIAAGVLGLAPSSLAGDQYKEVQVSFGDVVPSVLEPTSSSAKQFGQVVSMWNGRVAVSSQELAMDYQFNNEIGKRGRVNLFGSNYMRQFEDSGQDFSSSYVNDGYGTSLDLWRGTMLVGAPYDSMNGENTGKAYVYFGADYGSVQELTAENPEVGDYFGYSVAIVHGQSYYGEGMAVVGAYGHDHDDHDKESTTGQGCVFVYAANEYFVWSLVGRLEPQDFEHKDHGGFGYSLSSFGNTVAVGSYAAEKAFVFALLGHRHECPHEQDQNEGDFPEECQEVDEDEWRNLRRRSLQGHGPEEEKKFYTEWKYEHVLTVGLEEEHKPEHDQSTSSFGHTVALYNSSNTITLAVGAPNTVTDTGVAVGAVYVMSIMRRSDVTSGWYPEGYDHHDEDKAAEEAQREIERQEEEEREEDRRWEEEQQREAEEKERQEEEQQREAEEQERREEEEQQKEQEEQERREEEDREREEREDEDRDREDEDRDREDEDRDREDRDRDDRDRDDRDGRDDGKDKRRLQGPEDKNRFRTWNPQTSQYCGDKAGNFWKLEVTLEGSVAYERFGSSIAIGDKTLLIGNNPQTQQSGRAEYFTRSASTDSSYSGPIVSGPLYQTKWAWETDLSDSKGIVGDHFGFSVAFHGVQAVVGAIMPDLQSDGTFGQGVAYVYDRIRMVDASAVTASPTPSPAPVTDGSDASGSDGSGSNGSGSDESGSSESLDLTDTSSGMGITFIASVGIIVATLVFLAVYTVYKRSNSSAALTTNKQLRLASMDDSGSSDMQGLRSAYTGLDTSSSHGSRTSRLPPKTQQQRKATPTAQSRTFTPQAKRSFAPPSRTPNSDA